jgi:hypothetical protein
MAWLLLLKFAAGCWNRSLSCGGTALFRRACACAWVCMMVSGVEAKNLLALA